MSIADILEQHQQYYFPQPPRDLGILQALMANPYWLKSMLGGSPLPQTVVKRTQNKIMAHIAVEVEYEEFTRWDKIDPRHRQ